MRYIEKDTENRIVARFFDRRISTDTYFIWEIVNVSTKKIVKFITADQSTRPQSFNIFPFLHTSTEPNACTYVDGDYCVYEYPVTNTELEIFIEAGHNEYTVYETTEYSLDPQYIIKTIEKDIMFGEIPRTINTSNSSLDNVYI